MAFAQSTTASQSGYSGSFTASTPAAGQTDSCAGLAQIAPSDGTVFAVTPLAAGHCTFAIQGAADRSATLTVDITTTTVGGS